MDECIHNKNGECLVFNKRKDCALCSYYQQQETTHDNVDNLEKEEL